MPSSLGAPEILVILVVALIVLGPSKLPEAARQIGKAMGEVRRWSQSVQSEIRDVIDVSPDPPAPPSPPEPTAAASPAPPPPAPAPPPAPVAPEPPAPVAALPTSPGELPATTASVNGASANGSVAHAPDDTPAAPADESSSGGQPAG